jgi:hypothetical protein
MTWIFVRLGLPNSAVIFALALVPIIALAFDGTKCSEMRSNVVQAVTAGTSPSHIE